MVSRYFLIFSLLIFSFQRVNAAPVHQNRKPAVPVTSNVVRINPQSLQTLLLSRNNSLLQEMNKVYQAKENVNLARAQLLPSVNLGAILTGGPGFILSSVSFLMPFLLPSNWLDLKESQQLLDAEVESYYIAQLDQYASAYSVYMTVVGDRGLRDTLETQYENLQKIESDVDLAVKLGLRPITDLYSAQAQTQQMKSQVAQVDELLVRETASVREMLSLDLDATLMFEDMHPVASAYEGTPAKILLPSVLAKAPENAQIDDMIAAAKTESWSKAFSFFNGATLSADSQGADSDRSVSFSHLTQGSGFNIGFGIFPTVELSNLNTQEMQLRKQEIALEQAQVLETTLGSLVAAKTDYDAAIQAEQNFNNAYQAEQANYNLGTTDLLHVLSAANSLAEASINRIKAQTDVDSLRITLNRSTLKEYFATIPGCKVAQVKGSLIGNIFHPSQPVTLDQACTKPLTKK